MTKINMTYFWIMTSIVFSILWSSAFIAGKIAIRNCPPLLLLGIRFFIAGIILLIIAKILGYEDLFCIRNIYKITLLGILNNVLYLGLVFIGLKNVSASVVVVLVSLTPIITTMFSVLFLIEKITPLAVVGLILGLVGTAIIAVYDSNVYFDMNGLILILLGVSAFSLGTILFNKLELNNYPLLYLVAYQSIIGSVPLFIMSYFIEDFSLLHLNAQLIFSISYLVFVVSIGATILWFHILRKLDPSLASSVHYLNPIFGSILAVIFLGEKIHHYFILGLMMILTGIFLIQTNRRHNANNN
ncbi:DMT family transporter [Maridesulfovibrio zosterae]|uniref:DMT family transporter n=1 Tax=Maridesulfovibrio zosterae TaxID=82171 RepID=UPI0004126651|nr:DMT family transporter [Maridesulfovibrio zosterae]